MTLSPVWLRKFPRLNDEELFERMRFLSDEDIEQVGHALPLDRVLSLAQLDPGDDAEERQRAWAGYVDCIPLLVTVAAGTEVGTASDPDGKAVRVLPSYRVQVLALEVLSECGLGARIEGGTPVVEWIISDGVLSVSCRVDPDEILARLSARLDCELRSHLGVSLRQAQYRWRATIRWEQIRTAVRLGQEGPNLAERVLAARELGRAASGTREI